MTDKELREMLFQAIGEASMCWIPPPGNCVFDSSRAESIAAGVYNRIWRMLKVAEAAKDLLGCEADCPDCYVNLRNALRELEGE